MALRQSTNLVLGSFRMSVGMKPTDILTVFPKPYLVNVKFSV